MSWLYGLKERRELGLRLPHVDVWPQTSHDPDPVAPRLVSAVPSAGRRTGCIIIGAKTSGDSPTSVPLNPRAAIPTTVNGCPFSRMREPTTERLAAKAPHPRAVAQHRDRTTGSAGPGVTSSASAIAVPKAGCTPSTSK